MDELDGKIALITGAAKGIGAAIAERFAEEGAKLVLTDIDYEAICTLSDRLSDQGVSCISVKHDAREEADWAKVMEQARTAFGRLDILVNNAGVGPNKPLLETSYKDWRSVIATNLDSVFLGCRFGADAIRATETVPRRSAGSIINISSILGLVGMAATAPYSASKGGVRLLTKSVALEAAANNWNIRVNSVHPGFTWTPLVKDAVETLAEQSGEDSDTMRADIAALHPIGRLAEASEIAETVVFLASERSSFMTGTEMVVDGGYTSQ